MPTSFAASRFAAVASTALPSSVRLKKVHSSTTITAAPPSTQKLCGRIAAPPKRIGASPEKAGSEWNCLSKTTCASPRRKIEAPMVMMISVTAEAARRFDGEPVQQQADAHGDAMATSAASGSGTPAAATNTVVMPPIMTNSPCAKFTTSEAL